MDTRFPGSYIEALALLYVEHHITPDMSPEELSKLYWDTVNRLGKAPN